MTTRHIGGSLLPSSCPEILHQVETPAGTLQVRVIADEDTHGLFDLATGELLAKHPNGYSCHALAIRIHDGDAWRATEQADYIVACGGVVTPAGRTFIAKVSGVRM